MIITSLENDKIKEIIKLKNKKYRDTNNLFLVEGEHLVIEAYKCKLLKTIIIKDGFDLDLDVNKIYVSATVMDKISDMDSSPNYIGIVSKKEDRDLGNKILVLDDIQDPGNLGTIIRSSKAFNVDTIVLSNNSVDLYNSKVIRATQGMIFNINIIRRDLDEFIGEIKGNIPIYVTRVEDGEDIKTLDEKEKSMFALVMGNEGNGVRSSIIEIADKNIYIEMNKEVESLNVAVATSILLYEMR